MGTQQEDAFTYKADALPIHCRCIGVREARHF
jgi:hypothetical protein